jgi:hypothetical protein
LFLYNSPLHIACFVSVRSDSLRLTNITLSSTLSPSIGQLSRLAYLDLFSAGFGGSLPSEFGMLSDLKFLALAENNFTGTVPETLGSLDILGTTFLLYLFFYLFVLTLIWL